MAITLTELKRVDADIKAVCVNPAGTIVYLGTNEGEVWEYTVATGGMVLIKALDTGIVSMTLFGADLLYIATKGGQVYSLVTV